MPRLFAGYITKLQVPCRKTVVHVVVVGHGESFELCLLHAFKIPLRSQNMYVDGF